MKVQKFTAETMNEALLQISSTLGKDAVILQSRKVTEGGMFGLGEKNLVEVTAALDSKTRSAMPGGGAHSMPPLSVARNDESANSRKDVLKLAALTAQVEGLQDTVKVMSHRLRHPSAPALPDPLGAYYVNLIEKGLNPETTSSVLLGVYEALGKGELSKTSVLKRKIRDALVGLLTARESDRTPENEPWRVALIGPTGVGKTTTIAKLAASAKIYNKKSVALITADTFRVGAVEQLKSFAEILGMPMEVVYSRSEMRKAVDIHADKDVILIDTTGRSPKDTESVDDIVGLVTSAKPHTVHLVLSTSTEVDSQILAAKKFGLANVDSLIFTKLDETTKPAALFDVASRTNKSIVYLTTGQNVPDDIRKWDSKEFAGSLITETN